MDSNANAVAVPIPVAAQRLGVGRTTLYELIRTGEIATIAIGRRRVVPVAELDRYVTDKLRSRGG